MIRSSKLTLLVFMFLTISAFLNGQDYQVTFSILGNTNSPDSILVENSVRDLEQVLQNGDVLYLEDATTGISNNKLTKQPLRIYPNPMAEFATLEFYNPTQGKVSIEAYTMDGKLILHSNQNLSQGINSYALSGLSEGMYVVHLRTMESSSAALIISKTNTVVKPKIEWIATGQNNSNFTHEKSVASSQSIIKMPYNEGESLKFTAFLNESTSTEEYSINKDTNISFNFIPFTSFSANKTIANLNDAITFTDNSVNEATAWLWTFGDGGSSTLQNPTHTYTTVGKYSVALTASNAAGDSTVNIKDYIEVKEDSSYPSDVLSFLDEWKITLGTGSEVKDLIDYEHPDYFYITKDGSTDFVVYKTPNSGGTTANSSNTRSELRQFSEWTPETGGKLSGTLKVMHVSTSGDARVPATFSVVVGQIHSSEGNENEPLKIYYKKFPGHTKGSVSWNYEINTEGSNSERWDYSHAVWGNDWSIVGSAEDIYPAEPAEGIELGEEFSYTINVYDGIMYLSFTCDGHETKTFTKSLISSQYTEYADIPQQVLTVFSSTGQDGTEQSDAYSGELQYFKQGAYNQTNGKDPASNMIWNTGADTYGGDLDEQYANGSYTEVWFKEATVGAGTAPSIE